MNVIELLIGLHNIYYTSFNDRKNMALTIRATSVALIKIEISIC